MSNSILITRSLTRVFGAIVLVAGTTAAVACPPEEGQSQGQLELHSKLHSKLLAQLPTLHEQAIDGLIEYITALKNKP